MQSSGSKIGFSVWKRTRKRRRCKFQRPIQHKTPSAGNSLVSPQEHSNCFPQNFSFNTMSNVINPDSSQKAQFSRSLNSPSRDGQSCGGQINLFSMVGKMSPKEVSTGMRLSSCSSSSPSRRNLDAAFFPFGNCPNARPSTAVGVSRMSFACTSYSCHQTTAVIPNEHLAMIFWFGDLGTDWRPTLQSSATPAKRTFKREDLVPTWIQVAALDVGLQFVFLVG